MLIFNFFNRKNIFWSCVNFLQNLGLCFRLRQFKLERIADSTLNLKFGSLNFFCRIVLIYTKIIKILPKSCSDLKLWVIRPLNFRRHFSFWIIFPQAHNHDLWINQSQNFTPPIFSRQSDKICIFYLLKNKKLEKNIELLKLIWDKKK